MRRLLLIFPLVVLSTILFGQDRMMAMDTTTVFDPLPDQYSSMRIPALVVTKKGTLLAFAAGRIESGSDWADMDLLMKRSEDGGKTWGPQQIVAHRAGGKPTDNPTPIVGADGIIHLVYQRDYAYAYYTRSTDDGLTWESPADITSTFEQFRSQYDWKVLAPGPGHSIQLENGRLIVPVWLADSDKLKPHRSHRPSRIATIYSDDNGKTWLAGEMVPDVEGFKNPSETMAVELEDGRVALNIRNESDKRRRGLSYSTDGASGWSAPEYIADLFEPICMGSILRVEHGGKTYFVFSNPDSEKIEKHPRQNLTLKISNDGGRTWPIVHVAHPGSSGYSDLAVSDEGMVYCLFELRKDGAKGLSLVLQRFDIKELVKGKD